jgi:hypothetical protein
MARSTTLAALAAGLIGASVLGAASTAQAQYYYYPQQPYYAPVSPGYGYGYGGGGYGYGGPPAVYYDKDTAKAVARNWKEQQKARIKSGYYNQPQYYAPAPRQQYYAPPRRQRYDGYGYQGGYGGGGYRYNGPSVIYQAPGPHGHGG